MLTQEEYMDVLGMRRQGLTITEIAGELGYHPATISKWLKAGGPPPARDDRPGSDWWSTSAGERASPS